MRNHHQPILALTILLLSVLSVVQSVTIIDFPPCAVRFLPPISHSHPLLLSTPLHSPFPRSTPYHNQPTNK